MRWLAVGFTANFFYLQNEYFGWNRRPQSAEEAICDGIVILACLLTVIIFHLTKEKAQ